MKPLALMVLFLACAGVSCHAVIAVASPSQPSAGTSQHKEIHVGEELRITLESNRSTGYQWKLAKPLNQTVIKLVHSRYIGPAKQIPGAGGTEEWIFTGVGVGKTEIHLEYVRPWEKGGAPAKTVTYTVVVKLLYDGVRPTVPKQR